MMAAWVVLLVYIAALAIVCMALYKRLTRSRATGSAAGKRSDIIERINALLPQTQCGQCGHPGCRPYAEAISTGAAINRCPPGGANTIRRLANLLEQPLLPLDPRHGVESERKVAFIREHECIGCTKCIQACPVDAIVGAPKRMHTVIVRDCTGCDLCVEPCPVDCIDMVSLPEAQGQGQAYTDADSAHWQQRFE
ncbi:MAG: electron transport complex subunit RsxB, partial [Pseudohongiella sp.]